MADPCVQFSIDPSLAALIHDKRATARRPPAHVPIDKVRDAANVAMCRQPPGPPLAAVWEEVIDGPDHDALTLRYYRPDSAASHGGILFAHGGGFTLGSLDTHDTQCRWLAHYSRSLVVAVDYRLAPEHPHPAALNDCLAAWDWLNSSTGQGESRARAWTCAGDSAGANLMLALALKLCGRARTPAALALFYPILDPECDTASAHRMADGPGLSRDAMIWFWENYLGPDRTSSAAALIGQDLSGLPPTSLILAGCDPFLDEGLALADDLREAGALKDCRLFEGMLHGFLHLGALTPAAAEALQGAANHLRDALDDAPADTITTESN